MTTEEALLQAVLDAPEDDSPRLVFADWLEEQGRTPSARFIRSQIAGKRPVTVPQSWIGDTVRSILAGGFENVGDCA